MLNKNEIKVIIRVAIQIAVSMLVLVPIELIEVSEHMNTLIKVPLKALSLLMLVCFILVNIFLCLETLGIIFGVNLDYADLLYALLGEGLYPKQQS